MKDQVTFGALTIHLTRLEKYLPLDLAANESQSAFERIFESATCVFGR
jgi:hypothetical protein